MRRPAYSLRTGIMAQLVFLIVAAMLLIHVVEVRFSERDLIRGKVQAGRLLILAVEQNLRIGVGEKRDLRKVCQDPGFRESMTRLLSGSDFSGAVLVDTGGERVFLEGHANGVDDQDVILAREALKTVAWSTRFNGSVWGAIWLSPRELVLSAPLSLGGHTLGALTVRGPLGPIYEKVRQSQKFVLLYILLDALVLTVVGIVLLSRIVVKPIQKLLKMTEGYGEGDLVPVLGESPRNEIGELSRSLGAMLRRLEENKRELKAHIASLEKANKELHQAQGDLIRSEKLASVGRLAAGVAHEIGNPIGICLGYLDLLKKGDGTEEEKSDFLDRMESEISRIHETIRMLLDFSKPSTGKLQITRVHEMILDTLNILRPQPMMQDIHVECSLDAEEDRVTADPNRLRQVFLNIIMNAADALGERRPIPSVEEEGRLTIRTASEAGRVEIRFEDNGPGISNGELSRVFDPFYTTKEPGKGTGLGLSVCYRIVESMGGSIQAESEVGKGATFVVIFPLVEK